MRERAVQGSTAAETVHCRGGAVLSDVCSPPGPRLSSWGDDVGVVRAHDVALLQLRRLLLQHLVQRPLLACSTAEQLRWLQNKRSLLLASP